MHTLIERFLRYVQIDTQSDPNVSSCPSTEKQKNLSNVLVKELLEMGYDAILDEHGYTYTTIPKNSEGFIPIGFIAHVDTSPDAPGGPVKPRIINAYSGDTIQLNASISMHPNQYPSLKSVIGDDIIVTDGHTLLGADDKCGVSEIMELALYFSTHKDVLHGDIYICFTPDEEIGRGANLFNYDYFKADYAYTMDGSAVGGIEYENFNAATAIVEITGVSIHPGTAKYKMVNASHVMMKFHDLLPKHLDPSLTEGYEGFNHLSEIKSSVEESHAIYIIRNHDMEKFNLQKHDFLHAQDFLNQQLGYQAVNVTIKDSYFNMYEKIKPRMDIISKAEDAIKRQGLTPFSTPIRGGTDGARLTYEGLLCPNLGTGGFQFHGRLEFASIQQMHKALDIMIDISLHAKK